jgi:hypothetical protein
VDRPAPNARSEREPGERRTVEGVGLGSPDHPGLQLDEGAEPSSADADPRAGQEEGMSMVIIAIHII